MHMTSQTHVTRVHMPAIIWRARLLARAPSCTRALWHALLHTRVPSARAPSGMRAFRHARSQYARIMARAPSIRAHLIRAPSGMRALWHAYPLACELFGTRVLSGTSVLRHASSGTRALWPARRRSARRTLY